MSDPTLSHLLRVIPYLDGELIENIELRDEVIKLRAELARYDAGRKEIVRSVDDWNKRLRT